LGKVYTFVAMIKRSLLGLIVVISLMACKSEKNKLCLCIERSEDLNKLSSSILNMEIVSEAKYNELVALRKEIDSICKPFQDLAPEELYKMRNECIDPELLEMNK